MMTIHGGRYLGFFAVAAAGLAVNGCCTKQVASGPIPVRQSLNIPIGQPETDLESLRAQIEALPFSGNGWTRKRKKQGGDAGVSVKIRPVEDSRGIDSASGPATPMIVAWIENQNYVSTTENPIFKPKGQAQYLVQIYRDGTTGEAKYQILEVPSALRGTVTVINSGVLIKCYHPPKPAPDADFKSCDGYHEFFVATPNETPFSYASMSTGGESPPSATRNRSFLFNRPPRVEDPTWIACNAGCCTLAGTQSVYP